MGFRKSSRDLEAQSAAKEHTNEARGGGRGPGFRRPGAGLGHTPMTCETAVAILVSEGLTQSRSVAALSSLIVVDITTNEGSCFLDSVTVNTSDSGAHRI